MGNSVVLRKEQRDQILRLIQDAIGVRCHLEFFVWLQLGIGEFLPHDILLAAWGDFQSGNVQYDISSKRPRARSDVKFENRALLPFIRTMHAEWQHQNHAPILLSRADCDNVFSSMPMIEPYRLADARSCLVHGVHDKRSQQDCLYLFISFDQLHDERMKPVCQFLVPHVDATLRRIEVLPSGASACSTQGNGAASDVLTAREDEIMHWVSVGKTNDEIGQILAISPNTAKNHLRRIFKKLNVANRAQAVAQLKRR
ncbi:MAG: hypothetical protein IPG66_14800 [Hydrogenophilales bacterium]|nr:hypothetical protein [Hydrogenophilales bacterium]